MAVPPHQAARPAATGDDRPHSTTHPVRRYAAVRRHSEGVRGGPRDRECADNQRDRGDDGWTERVPGGHDLDALIRQLGDQASEGGIRVFTIAYGEDADLDSLKRISEASRAAAHDATDPLTIDSVFTNVLSNF